MGPTRVGFHGAKLDAEAVKRGLTCVERMVGEARRTGGHGQPVAQ